MNHMPRSPRFFISPEQVAGQRITLIGEDVRHIATVLRMKPRETLLLCDGKGMEYTATIVQVAKNEIVTEIASESKRTIPSLRVTLGQGIPKFDKMDWIVQKAVELGVSRIIPLATERTIVKLKDEQKRVLRWQKIAREAAMQSNRADIPQVSPIVFFRDFLAPGSLPLAPSSFDPGSRTLKLLPWEEASEPIKNILHADREADDIVILIGPEGGFSSTEAESAKSRGFQLVSLGPNILRTETAALAVLSMVLYETSTKQ